MEHGGARLIELKPDKMPIAIYENMNSFTNQHYQLKTGDVFYMLSDGYEDQFGGPKGKKFMSKQFKQLVTLLTTSRKTQQLRLFCLLLKQRRLFQ
jgi:serine phosphatase RsbU (regulator of sigma subunit)